MKYPLETKEIREAAALLASLGNYKRLTILYLLTTRELAVGALAIEVELSQSALSQHLARLRNQGLVVTRREAQTVYYSCTHPSVLKILTTLQGLSSRDRQT
ncbi:hypothetical protein A6U97_26010 [Agrobacterium tumefaciens]|uniref:ArsR/SmtB family transcription factor n=1 Tax=Agrobacterium tumefaciens TaxID=358 RepID=UPI000810003D|nr:hypothetical protein A6U97_26010 [Agrobacterium tumefaciens]